MGVVVVSALPIATRVQFVVSAEIAKAGVGVPPEAWLSCCPWVLTALDPSFEIPVMASTCTAPALFEPVATVTTVEVVFTIKAVRMKTDMR